MTFAVDANILILASNTEDPLHARARQAVESMVAGPELAYLFWPSLIAYIRVVTHAALQTTHMSVAEAMDNIEGLLSLPHVRTGSEGHDFLALLRAVGETVPARGKLIHDAHIVALMRQHGVTTIWTHDRDFRLFDGIRAVDPLA